MADVILGVAGQVLNHLQSHDGLLLRIKRILAVSQHTETRLQLGHVGRLDFHFSWHH